MALSHCSLHKVGSFLESEGIFATGTLTNINLIGNSCTKLPMLQFLLDATGLPDLNYWNKPNSLKT